MPFILLLEVSDFFRACEAAHFGETRQDTDTSPMRHSSRPVKARKKRGQLPNSEAMKKSGSGGGVETVLDQNDSEELKS